MYWVSYGDEYVPCTGLCMEKNVYYVLDYVLIRTCTVNRVRYGEERVLCTGLCMEKNVCCSIWLGMEKNV